MSYLEDHNIMETVSGPLSSSPGLLVPLVVSAAVVAGVALAAAYLMPRLNMLANVVNDKSLDDGVVLEWEFIGDGCLLTLTDAETGQKSINAVSIRTISQIGKEANGALFRHLADLIGLTNKRVSIDTTDKDKIREDINNG